MEVEIANPEMETLWELTQQLGAVLYQIILSVASDLNRHWDCENCDHNGAIDKMAKTVDDRSITQNKLNAYHDIEYKPGYSEEIQLEENIDSFLDASVQ